MGIMRFLFAPDSFKGTLSSEQIIDIFTEEASKVFPGCKVVSVPMADGGEGTEKAIIKAAKGKHVQCTVKDPLGRPVLSGYGVTGSGKAIVEMAAASGLPMLTEEELDPRLTSTYGTGELILAALDAGCRNITMAAGGSATNDGGMGCLRALGVRFLDADGAELEGTGSDLAKVASIDVSSMHPAIKETEMTVMCDVDNPLLGERGATYIYGPQKGATPAIADELEAGMENYEKLVFETTGMRLGSMPGTGAAGGISGAMCAFCGAKLRSGVQTVLDLIDFDTLLDGVDLVVTGEGKLDAQSSMGKVLCGIGEACKAKDVPAVAVVGCIGEGAEEIYKHGILSVVTTVSSFEAAEVTLKRERSAELCRSAAERLFRLVKAGIGIGKAQQ